jgi:predicted amidohydrolase
MPRSRPSTILAGGIQLVSVTGDPPANVAKITRLGRELKSAHPQLALLVAPELAVTGYSAGERFHALAEPWPHGDSLRALAALARELEVVLVAGYVEASSTPGLIYDSAAVFERNGQPIASCRKSHCLDGERSYFTDGDDLRRISTSLG